MDYIPNTEGDRKKMLQEMGLHSIEPFLADIPKTLRNFSLKLPHGLSEPQVFKVLKHISKKKYEHRTILLISRCRRL